MKIYRKIHPFLPTLLLAALLIQPLSCLPAVAEAAPAAAPVWEDDDPGASRLGGRDSAADLLQNPFLSQLRGSSQITSKYTKQTYTNADIFDGKNIYNGIDVSRYNTDIDWKKVKADGIDFAIIRVGYRGYGSAGALVEDPLFKQHMEGALAAGLKVGAYFFTQAVNTEEAAKEAEYVLEKIAPYKITMPVALDFEWPTEGGKPVGRMYNAKLSKAGYTNNCKQFCATIAAKGYTPMVYANASDLTNSINGAELAQSYKVWLANYTTKTSYSNPYEFWQYSSNGMVNGITDAQGKQARVDCNFWYTNRNIQDLTGPSTGPAISIQNGMIAPVEDQIYTGKALTPAVTLTVNGSVLNAGTDYSVTYTDNISAGTATITVTGTGNYSDTLTASFHIYPKKVEDLTAVSAAKSVTLRWDTDTGGSGVEIYRKDTYNGSYKKIKTISSGDVGSWKNGKLSKKHEYYYRIRAFATTADDVTIYSGYTKLTKSTCSSPQVAIAPKSLKLLKKPAASAKKLATVKKGTSLVYAGITHLKNKNKFHHVRYVTTAKTYDGYLPAKTRLNYYKQGVTTTLLNLRKTPGTSGKAVIQIPKNTELAILGKKKVHGDIWYKTTYSGKKGKIYTGYVSSNYIK